MSQFTFCGEVPSSKSLLNRWLLVRDYAPTLQVTGSSTADDVVLMSEGLRKLHADVPVNCGAAGTVLRFLCLRASRIPGRHILFGTPRLLSRPHDDLVSILHQLGVQCQISPEQIEIEGMGWQNPQRALQVDPTQTSQFASAVLLNSWDLDFSLTFEWKGSFVSKGYFAMSCRVAETAGMKIEYAQNSLQVPAHQRVALHNVHVEADLSSTFALAAIAAVAGSAEFENFPFHSLQPDSAFVDILERLGVRLEYGPSSLKVHKSAHMKAVHVSLTDCPDLFPVLAVLCSCAHGQSRLDGAPQLKFKESDRLTKTAELLKIMNVPHEILRDGLVIEGRELSLHAQSLQLVRTYDSDEDHRLAMAAQLANWIGYRVDILHREVVNKSFPAFWDLAGVSQ